MRVVLLELPTNLREDFTIMESARTELKALVGAFNQDKALVGALSVITNLRMQFGWNFLRHYW